MAQRGVDIAIFLFCFVLCTPQAFACKLAKGESVVIAAVTDDAILELTDGRSVRLAGVEVSQSAAAHFEGLVGQRVTLRYGDARIDRYGRVLAFVMLQEGGSLQERLIEDGAARVAPSRDMRLCAGRLLDAEARARRAGRGIWNDPAYAVRQADDIAALERLEGGYQLAEGVVKAVSNVRGRIYINFGEDWREDFTVTVAPADAKLFKGEPWARLVGKNPELAGTKIRVRGYIARYYGPGITVTVPEQIELLDPAMADERKQAADDGGDRKVSRKTRRKTGDAQR